MKLTSKKGPALRIWIRDRVVFLALIIFVAGASIYLGAGKVLSPDSEWLHPLKEFSLLISMIGMVSLGYELFLRELTFNEYKQALEEIVNPHAVRLGIQGIYKNRSELAHAHTFEKLFKNVKGEIFIGGTSLLSISTNSRELLKEKVLDGLTVRLLLMDPESKVVEMITRQAGGKPTFVNEIKTSLLLFQRLQEEIDEAGPSNKGKLIVHTYHTIPSHSFIAIDMNEHGGFIIADIGPYLGRSYQRPSMLVVKKKGGMFDYWKAMNEAMWDESKPLPSETAKASSPSKTQLLVSGKDTEFFDPHADQWNPAFICDLNPRWRGIKGSQWVWIREKITLEEAKTGSQHRFRVTFDLPGSDSNHPLRAELFVRSDDTCHVTVNDVGLKQEFGGSEYPDPFIMEIGKYLTKGSNTVQFEVINYAKPVVSAPEDNPSGLIYKLHLEYEE